MLAVECSLIAHLCSHLFCLTCAGLSSVTKVFASVVEQRQQLQQYNSELPARFLTPGRRRRAALPAGPLAWPWVPRIASTRAVVPERFSGPSAWQGEYHELLIEPKNSPDISHAIFSLNVKL